MDQLLAEQSQLARMALTADDACNQVPNSYILRSVREDIYRSLRVINESVQAIQLVHSSQCPLHCCS